MEALGREQAVNKVQIALQFLSGMPPEILPYVKFDSLLSKAFNGLDLPDAVRSQAEVQEMQQQQMQQQMAMAAGQTAAQTAGAAGAEAVMAQATQTQQGEMTNE